MKLKVEKLKLKSCELREEKRRGSQTLLAPWKSATIWLPQHPGIVARILPRSH